MATDGGQEQFRARVLAFESALRPSGNQQVEVTSGDHTSVEHRMFTSATQLRMTL
ncbi:hypothetical protein ACIRRA_45240 [Nocardia sp. NPDC101769]|uniref:hypothetical protein n=1 Tax=Nocardia sp. NPDC101769 TaxID=3364333 RepID=UPI00380C6050